jgi:hypothetical protein
MKFSSSLLSALPLVTFLVHAQEAPSADSLVLTSQSYSGSGCPSSSAASSASGGAVTEVYSAYTASADPPNKLDNSWVNCTTTLTYNVPSGWKFSLDRLYSTVTADLKEDKDALYQYWFSMDGAENSVSLIAFICPSRLFLHAGKTILCPWILTGSTHS